MGEKLKDPSDYPQFAFRVSQDDKDEIMRLLDKVHRKLRAKDKEGYEATTRNKILVNVIKNGLRKLA